MHIHTNIITAAPTNVPAIPKDINNANIPMKIEMIS